MLILRGTSKIKKFALSCNGLFDESRINAWISTIIRCEVAELILVIEVKEAFKNPLSLFTCESLIKLKLEINSILYLPKSISFPRLRYLELYRVKFRDEYLNEQLFSNCPVLEELILLECTWVNMKSVCISAPALKRLMIDGHYRANGDIIHNCEVKIHAPGLEYLTYKMEIKIKRRFLRLGEDSKI
ncbi:hypothetical protein BVC80_9021g38 [Macleaya cordata]|uniref:F-box/LRR-repeat protein 15/At3g58940/PEG3-like LRR domain-containing protein n=1 Tax=Macleaya cordata TaxID=56857 RepID=A0A200QV17_MACCD|nr:hypothetical protein BVC80_9021g38 [Macleaya cordata]